MTSQTTTGVDFELRTAQTLDYPLGSPITKSIGNLAKIDVFGKRYTPWSPEAFRPQTPILLTIAFNYESFLESQLITL